MLIQSGRVSSLSALPWVAIELSSEERTDIVTLHLVRWAIRHLESRGKPFQLLYPVESRSSTAITLLSPYLWLRVADPSDLYRYHAGAIMGFAGMVSDSAGRPLLTDPSFVATLIERSRSAADQWSDGIVLGSGVRVLLGSAHGLCGIVESLTDGDATVRIALRSRAVRLRIPVRALQRLSDAPKDYFEKENC